MHKKYCYQPTRTITMQPPKGYSSAYCDSDQYESFDSYERLALDLMLFISKTYMPARGQHKNQLVKFMDRYIRLKGWGFNID